MKGSARVRGWRQGWRARGYSRLAVEVVLAALAVALAPVEVHLLQDEGVVQGTILDPGVVQPVLEGDLAAVAGVGQVVGALGGVVVLEAEGPQAGGDGGVGGDDVDGGLVGQRAGRCGVKCEVSSGSRRISRLPRRKSRAKDLPAARSTATTGT